MSTADWMLVELDQARHEVDVELEAVLRAGGLKTKRQITGSRLVWRIDTDADVMDQRAGDYWALVLISDSELPKQRVRADDYAAYKERATDAERVQLQRPQFFVDDPKNLSPTQRHVLQRLQRSDDRPLAPKRWWDEPLAYNTRDHHVQIANVLPDGMSTALHAPALLSLLQPSSLEPEASRASLRREPKARRTQIPSGRWRAVRLASLQDPARRPTFDAAAAGAA